MKVKNKSPWVKVYNSEDAEGKSISSFTVDTDDNKVKETGDGILMFSKPVVITDNSEMWSGAKYDIPTLDISQYKGKLTADHRSSIQYLIGDVIGLKKVANRKVTIDGIDLAVKENPLADFVKRMMLAGRITDFSIETIGPWPDDEGIYKNSRLVGLSVVVTGNNKNAHINNADAEINQIAMHSIAEAEKNGSDTTSIKELLKYPIDKNNSLSDNDVDMFKTIKNTRDFAIEITYKNAAGDEVKTTLQPNSTMDVSADQETALNEVIKNAVAPEKKETKTETKTENAVPAGTDIAAIVTASVKAAVESQVKPLTDQINALEKKQFDNGITEPGFVKNSATGKQGKIADLSSSERDRLQVQSALDGLARKDQAAMRVLNDINKYNLEELQKAGKVDNAITMGDLGNFVISPELFSTIEGFRSNYEPFLAKTNWGDTLSLEMAWLNRSGDINMQNVEMCDDDEDGNLKPISEYGATIKTAKLEELAAVTPVCNAATRFLAVDILSDIAKGYRNDFDRKRAQLVIARLQQAVNETGQTENYNTTAGNALNPLNSIIDAAGKVAETVEQGIWVFSYATYYELLGKRLAAGINTDAGFDLFTTGNNPSFLGMPYVVVPNDLMPKLGSSQTRSFTVQTGDAQTAVTINQGMFLADLSYFTGRTSGGLRYDLSTEAAYEDNGTVKSAFQRDELILRGYFYRGGAIRDVSRVSGVKSLNFS